jgi:lipoprotein-anchoring transpeptidase ErfK/SrfK
MLKTLRTAVPLLAVLASPAVAQYYVPMTGDPAIDAQWRTQPGQRAYRAVPVEPGVRTQFRLPRGYVVVPDGYVVQGQRLVPFGNRGTRQYQQVRAPAVAPQRSFNPAFLPAVVDFETRHAPGTIVINPDTRYLYLVMEGGKARRYGIGVGRDGFGWSGEVRVGRKAEWPTWTPPAEMRKRQPDLPIQMAGGPDNPLGARALYLHQGGKDTLFRIHGSNEPWTIGHAVSSGCFRMRNEDVVDLYQRVKVGTRVVVL